MKGLLYKDFCMAKKYCRSYLLIIIVFLFVSIFNPDNKFFVFYPCLIVGMLPTNLLSYDERSKWVDYSKCLPYSEFDIVSSKYLIGLISMVIVVSVNIICQVIINNVNNIILFSAAMVFISLLISSLPLTFMFRYGVEKGRISYYIMLGFFTAFSFLLTSVIETYDPGYVSGIKINLYVLSTVMIIIAVGLYILMWRLSIIFYKKNKQ